MDEPLVHFGIRDSYTVYCGGQGDDYDVYRVKERLMGKRPCRWLREGDWVCVDLHQVTCELCLKSRAAKAERSRMKNSGIRPNMKDAESRLFWKRLREDVDRYERETTPSQRFTNYVYMNRPERIAYVAKIEGKAITLA